ncbi:MAG TPA: RNA 2',3'-cyclic phosphodiesterase [Luteimonas sp.]|nr:RNA 2',3'-cyclic phosphodiesterase [Luteimonas sp.]
MRGMQANAGGQMGLGLGDARPSDRLFFALFPDAAAVARIDEVIRLLRRQHGLRGRALPADHFHVTLHFLGDYPQDLWPQVAERAAEAASRVRLPPFDARFDYAASFAARRKQAPFVLRSEAGRDALCALHASLDQALRRLGGLIRAEHSFEPHLTLMYDEREIAAQPIDPIAWRAEEFVLVRSRIGRGEYEPLDRWPLRA